MEGLAMKDNSTGKPKDFYSLGKEIFDLIKVLEKPKNDRKLHNLPIQQPRPGQRPPGRKTALQAQPA
jgi:hypothetical protein